MRLIEDKLLTVSKAQMETKGAAKIKQIEEPFFQATFKYWNDSKDNTEPRAPVVKFVVTVRKERGKGATLRVRAYAQNPSTKSPSLVWHLMEGGVGAHIQKKNSPPLFFRKSPRTRVKDLNVQPFTGFANKRKYHIKAGTLIRATPARLWYEVIRDLTVAAIQAHPAFKNAEITKVKIERPRLASSTAPSTTTSSVPRRSNPSGDGSIFAGTRGFTRAT